MAEVGVAAPTVWSIAVGVVAFLTAWAAKHFLDATALPLIKDRWAKLSARRAKKRAEWLAANYRHERRIVASPRYLLLELEKDHAIGLGLFVLNIAYGLAGLIIWLELLNSTSRTYKLYAGLGLMLFFVLCAWLYLRSVLRAHAKFRKLLRNPKNYRRDLIGRLRSLLSSAGMDATEVKSWLAEEIPPLAEPALRLAAIKRAEGTEPKAAQQQTGV